MRYTPKYTFNPSQTPVKPPYNYSSAALLFPSLFLGGGTTVLTAGYSLLGLLSLNLSHCTSQTIISTIPSLKTINKDTREQKQHETLKTTETYPAYQNSYYTSSARIIAACHPSVPVAEHQISFSAQESFANP